MNVQGCWAASRLRLHWSLESECYKKIHRKWKWKKKKLLGVNFQGVLRSKKVETDPKEVKVKVKGDSDKFIESESDKIVWSQFGS